MASPFKQVPVALTATTTSGTKHGRIVKVTTETLTTIATASYTFTLTNNCVAANSCVVASVCYATGTGGLPVITTITPAAGTVAVTIQNNHASTAFSGGCTLVITIVVL